MFVLFFVVLIVKEAQLLASDPLEAPLLPGEGKVGARRLVLSLDAEYSLNAEWPGLLLWAGVCWSQLVLAHKSRVSKSQEFCQVIVKHCHY